MRRKLTQALHKEYFSGIKYYLLNVFNKNTLDNPDQRMTADADLLCKDYGSIIADILVAPFTIAYYTYSAFTRAGWIGPTGMFGFFIVSSVINKFLMSPIVRLTVEREKQEGNFRFRHATIRSTAESLAFLGSEAVMNESREADKKLNSLCSIQQSVYNRQLVLNLATNGFDYLGSIASFLVISVPIFNGTYNELTPPELSRIISENAFVCMYLIYQFSKLVDLASSVSTMAGVTHRIAELFEVLGDLGPKDEVSLPYDTCHEHPYSEAESSRQLVSNSTCVLNVEGLIPGAQPLDPNLVFSIRNFDLKIPNEQTVLIRSLDVDVELNQNILIMGNSSTGKSSFLRVLRGLWEVPGDAEVFQGSQTKFFIPQKMFLSEDCSLRDQVTYPKKSLCTSPEEDEWILQNLTELGLLHMLERCGGDLDTIPTFSWRDELSPGELQRLCFARLFFHRPQVAILDEATSALSTDVEEQIYQKCLDMGMTLISVGHRENLKKFHQVVLELGLPDAGWKLTYLISNR